MRTALGIIAGTGDIPRRIIDTCRLEQRPFFVLAYEGYTDPSLVDGVPHQWFPLGIVGKALDALRDHNVRDIVFAGGGKIQRPSFRSLALDPKGAQLLAKIGWRWLGDNKILETISAFLENEGFTIQSPQDILQDILASKGLLSNAAPSPQALDDIHLGQHLLDTLSPFDFGQGVAIEQGLILGIEAAEGTDACIRRCGPLRRQHAPVYVKRAKSQQDTRVDLPVIGPQTIHALHEAGFAGLCCQADKTLILSKDQVIDLVNTYNLFLLSA